MSYTNRLSMNRAVGLTTILRRPLYLQKGMWNGEQLISKEWVEESTRAHLIANAQLDQHYGYYWWRETFPINTRWIESYFASGNGGNKIYVFPTEDLVVVITASAYSQKHGHPQVRMMMNKYILPAVIQDVDSQSGGPDIKTVPRIGFVISELVFSAALIFCILWPSAFLRKPLRAGQSKSSDSGNNRRWLRLVRIWIGANALVGILFVAIVLGEATTLDLWLNSGYARPLHAALHKVIASWAITILEPFYTGSEKSLNFIIQIKKPETQKLTHLFTNRRFPDTTNTCQKYTHVYRTSLSIFL